MSVEPTPRVLDVRGLSCPLPVLRAKKALKDLPSGQTLTVLATDPGAVADFDALAKAVGYDLLESSQQDGTYTFRLRSR